MVVEAYIIAWNESETIHLTIKHYQQFCQRIIIYDNFSTDNTREICEALGCEVKPFGIAGVLDDREYTKLKNNCWKGSKADWVIVVDADEILWADNILDQLNKLRKLKFGMISTQGWQVVSQYVPRESWLEITNGFIDENYSKFVIFDPKAVKEMNYVHGCHIAKPVNSLCTTNNNPGFILLHYRNVGGYQRLIDRHKLYRERMSDWNIKWKAGSHYLYEDAQRKREWLEQLERAGEFVPLGG